MYGASIQNDVMNELAQKVFFDTAVAEGWKIAGMPRLEGVEGQDDKENFLFSGVFEVFPEVKVGDLSGQEVEKVTASVGDAEVEKTSTSCVSNAPASTTPNVRPKTATASSSTSQAKSTAKLLPAVLPKTTPSYWAKAKCCPSLKQA